MFEFLITTKFAQKCEIRKIRRIWKSHFLNPTPSKPHSYSPSKVDAKGTIHDLKKAISDITNIPIGIPINTHQTTLATSTKPI